MPNQPTRSKLPPPEPPLESARIWLDQYAKWHVPICNQPSQSRSSSDVPEKHLESVVSNPPVMAFDDEEKTQRLINSLEGVLQDRPLRSSAQGNESRTPNMVRRFDGTTAETLKEKVDFAVFLEDEDIALFFVEGKTPPVLRSLGVLLNWEPIRFNFQEELPTPSEKILFMPFDADAAFASHREGLLAEANERAERRSERGGGPSGGPSGGAGGSSGPSGVGRSCGSGGNRDPRLRSSKKGGSDGGGNN
ncbi:hypothetical protein ACEPAF_5384 [Sanghuangporus sanghuang]